MNKLISKVIALAAFAAPTLSLAAHQPSSYQGSPELEVARGAIARIAFAATSTPPQIALPAWRAFTSQTGGTWRAIWDADTKVPLRIYGSGIAVPGSVQDASIAKAHALQMLERHIALLAPGAALRDFHLVSNEVHRGIRSLGFTQSYMGMPVIGGQLSFRYKADRLVVMGSEALSFVKSDTLQLAPGISDSEFLATANRWILQDRASRSTLGAVSSPRILPIIRSSGVEYRTVVEAIILGQAPIGKWRVYLDARTGALIAREQMLHFGTGSLSYNVPVRQPLSTRQSFSPQNLDVTLDGSPTSTDASGQLSWSGAAAVQVETGVSGPLIAVTSTTGTPLTNSASLNDGGELVFAAANDEVAEAQLSAFIHAKIVKDHVRGINPTLEWLDTQLPVRVNIDDDCNAFSDGNSINFFLSSGQCANTALLADVVYHEFGHSMHSNSIIEGVGAFDGAFSEGLSDYLSASITNDPAMGVGFFRSDAPLRHIDPLDREHIWPQDVGEIHFTGIIFAGAMWDLRKTLIEKYGQDLGASMSDQYFYGAVQRASNIPGTYIEVLLEDDDDGDLSNGTPNICDINATFGAHGLRVVDVDAPNLSVVDPSLDGYDVELRVLNLLSQCPGDSVKSASIDWALRGDNSATEEITMAASGEAYLGTIPKADEGEVVRYSLTVEFSDGSVKRFPDNPADPRYEFYVGSTVELYCTDFERDPFSDGWSHGLTSGSGDGADDWSWGVVSSPRSSGDPTAAYSGTSIIGNDIGGENRDGSYQPNVTNFVLSPIIDIGNYSDVRLQYRRWLNVEDGFFDKATIYSNNMPVWTNLNSDNDSQSTIHHTDREWRFHDVPLIGTTDSGSVQIKYEIDSDQGLEFGGWNIDDFCIIANPNSICGDAELFSAEECDEGDANSDTQPDACRTNCLAPRCGDGVIDTGETCDDGNTNDSDGCTTACLLPGENPNDGDCGCTVAANRPWSSGQSAIVFLLGLGLFFLRRKKTTP